MGGDRFKLPEGFEFSAVPTDGAVMQSSHKLLSFAEALELLRKANRWEGSPGFEFKSVQDDHEVKLTGRPGRLWIGSRDTVLAHYWDAEVGGGPLQQLFEELEAAYRDYSNQREEADKARRQRAAEEEMERKKEAALKLAQDIREKYKL